MKIGNCLIIAILYLVGCKTNHSLRPDNPRYSDEIEKHIEQVVNHLQVETPVEGIYETKTLAGQMKYYHTPGISNAVIHKGKIEWARGFGIRNENNDPADVHTLFEAGSVSKPVFALVVMRLKEQGKIDLDKNVNEYLHSWKIPSQNGWTPVISFRKLLSHTAGMRKSLPELSIAGSDKNHESQQWKL
jgi:CubicO group peptidase (beta-lactamase class C family)